ncbi:MAG: hypothetical protein M3022_12740, partial [Actinomycetota bacterium]|nr:hypothetical protein [Actinomycetota bacterium]
MATGAGVLAVEDALGGVVVLALADELALALALAELEARWCRVVVAAALVVRWLGAAARRLEVGEESDPPSAATNTATTPSTPTSRAASAMARRLPCRSGARDGRASVDRDLGVSGR